MNKKNIEKMSIRYQRTRSETFKISRIELDSYKKMFKHIITKNINNNSSHTELNNNLSSITEKENFFSYIIFTKYILSFKSYINNDENIEKFLFNINKEQNINKRLLILWYIFLLNCLSNKKMNLENGTRKLNQLNEIRYFISQTNDVIFKLYLTDKLNEKDIFIYVDLYLFWFENYTNFCFINEKNRKIKNYYIFKYLFSLVHKILVLLMKNINKEKLGMITKFMENLIKSDEINKEYNIIILIKYNFIQSFIQMILSNIDFKKVEQIDNKFQDILINFMVHFLKFKFNLSNIFDMFLDNLRIGYEHLYNFEDNSKKIVRDLKIENFQTKLIKKLLDLEEDIISNENFPIMSDSFLFNGIDSIIAFKMDNFDFLHNCLFFSFNINQNFIKNNSSNIYPLIVIQKEITKDSKNFNYENALVLYLEKLNKKENGNELYSLNVSQPLINAKISLKKEEKVYIKKNVNYYCCLYFEENNIKIFLYNDSINKVIILNKKIKLSSIPTKNIILSIGCDSLLYNKDPKDKDEKRNYFSGYIGPIIIIKGINTYIQNYSNLEEIIEKILSLKGEYKDLLFFKRKNKSNNNNNINFNQDFIDYSLNKGTNKNINYINSLVKKRCKYFECLLFLVPNCFTYYHNKNDIKKNYHLPLISNYCNQHKDYKIKKINITLFKYNLSSSDFIYANGFNYFCLQFEYFNQLCQYYLVNKENNIDNFKDIFMNDTDLFKDIIYSIKVNLLILGNRGNEINLSKTYKQTFMVLLYLLKNLNKIKPIINDIKGDLISLSDIYKCNIFTNYYNLKDVLSKQENIKNELSKENEKNKKGKKILTEEEIQSLKEYYNKIIKMNCSFFVGIMEILLSKEFYTYNKKDSENYLLMKLTFEKVSSIMDIQDYGCLSFFSYQNLFNQALSFTDLLGNLMQEYLPDIEVLNRKNNNNIYSNYAGKNYIKTSPGESNALISYFKFLNIFFRNKAINTSTSKEYFKKIFQFILGNHRYDLYIVYNFLHMFYYFIAENYKFYINYEEIMQIFDYLNEITNLEEEDVFNNKESNEEINNNDAKIEKKEEEIIKINHLSNIENKNKNNFAKIKEKIKSVLICIIIEILFSQKELPEAFNNLLVYLNKETISKNLFSLIKDEIDKYCHITFSDDENSLLIKKNIKNISTYYSNIFKLITSLLCSLLSDSIDYDISEDNNILKDKETQKMWCVLSMINVLSDISNEIEDNINKEIFKKETINCIINFLKFLYDIVIDDQLNILYVHDLFFAIAENVFNHCNKVSLNNSNILIDLDNERGAMKTVVEIIFDIYIEYSTNIYLNPQKKSIFRNNNNNIKYFAMLKIQNYFIMENKNKKLKDKKVFNYNEYVSIFFINDYFKLLSTNKKYIKNDLFYFDINEKINDLKEINNSVKNEKKFELIYMIFFLIKIEVYKQEITKKIKKGKIIDESQSIKNLNLLNDILIYMQKIILDDYKKIYIINKEFCSKSNSDYPCYNTVKNNIELKIANETKRLINDNIINGIINDLSSKIGILPNNDNIKIKSGLSLNKKNIIKRRSHNFSVIEINKKQTVDDKDLINFDNRIIEGAMTFIDKTNNNNLLNDNISNDKNNNNIDEQQIITKRQRKLSLNDDYINKETDNIFNFINRDSSHINRVIPIPNIDSNILFFEQYDEMYLKNPKKELMNTLFAYNFKKSFYYNDTFEILKKYYLNNYDAEEYTKRLNYPSKMKHFNNGLEPPLFLKYNKSFYISKVFPITHDYFYNYMTKRRIINDSIILFKNKLPIYNMTKTNKKEKVNFDYNCELILVDHSFYGHIINSNDNGYIIFQEKKFEFYNKEPINNMEYYSDLLSISTIIKKPNNSIKEIINDNQRNKKTKKVERGINKEIIILYSDIEQIMERRFLLMWQGIEIYLKNGKSYFFNILDDSKCQKILNIFNKNRILSKKLLLRNNFKRDIDLIQKEWVFDRLSTYEYLLYINKYSNRSYNDSNQYIIFPWLLKNYNILYEINNNQYEIIKYINQIKLNKLEEKEEDECEENNIEAKNKNTSDSKGNVDDYQLSRKGKPTIKYSKVGNEYFKYIRELKSPVCAQTERNKEMLIKRYLNDCQFNFKYHSGTHYSTSAYVYFYLMRNEPFSGLLIKLQNYCQENPNRMFNCIQDTLATLDTGNDNRELLPEFFSKIDQFFNYNCVNLGKRVSKKIVDDAYISRDKIRSPFNLISNVVDFIIEHKKLLNSEIISLLIGDWIDNIFGFSQLPEEEDRPLTCNIYVKSSYEQKTNLKNKLKKYISPDYKKRKLTPEKIVKIICDKINMIICLGQTPYQIFNEKHPERNKEDNRKIEEKEEEIIDKDKNNKNYIHENDLGEDFLLGEDDVQSLIINFIRPKKTISNIEVEGLYFEINPFINKVFILSRKREILILNSKLYDRKGENYFNVNQEQKIELPHIKYFEKIKNEYIKDYYIYKQKYCFSSFIKESNDKNYYFYYNKYVNELIEENELLLNKDKKDNINNEIKNYKFITCRYLDNTFKISLIPSNIKEAQKKKEKSKEKINNEDSNINKIFSFLCEDFVTSCCAISNDAFLIGLKNGKLIKGNIIETNNESNNPEDISIQINYEKYIQGHKGSINVIEIDYRLGVIITGGDDNYIYIRKLYDMELLTPIKINDKYIITMAKISPMNLLYVVCLNKINKHSIILGYNLSGVQFAKSEYGYFTNIDFTKSGNIVSLINKIRIGILFGSSLKRIKIKETDEDRQEFINKEEKVSGALWMQYDYFTRKNDNTKCRVISYIAKDYSFNTINVDNIKYFE